MDFFLGREPSYLHHTPPPRFVRCASAPPYWNSKYGPIYVWLCVLVYLSVFQMPLGLSSVYMMLYIFFVAFFPLCSNELSLVGLALDWVCWPLSFSAMTLLFGSSDPWNRDSNPPVSDGRLRFLRLKYGIPLVCATSRFFAAPASKTFASFFFTYLTLM